MNGLYHCICHDGHDIAVSKVEAVSVDCCSLIITTESLQLSGARYIAKPKKR